ncbi:hydroxyacid dehydrogenase [Pelagibacteraceae bacterium]|jgi:D-3-phosphoglycerate dehydrogenase|nr:hydroxyacid dehydrogenase [Pelagibacteraceae bacterium]
MFKIGILQRIHEEGIKILDSNKNFEFEVIDDLSPSNLLDKINSFDGITLRTTKLTNDILLKASRLKVISRHGVGYDNVDTNFLKKKNISLFITATANAQAVSEHVFYMMLTISKNFLNLDKEVRVGNFKKNMDKLETFELNNKEILIAGFGRIGKNLIKKCIGFDMKVKVYDPFVDASLVEQMGGTKIENFDLGIQSADFLSIHMPLNKETKNLLNMSRIQTMKNTAVIINTARGGIINEHDLDKALNEKIILAAGLDVFENEPLNLDSPLLKNRKVILSPHTAALTNECRIRMAKETTQNLVDFFENKINKTMLVNL